MDQLTKTHGALACDLVGEILRKFGRVRLRVKGISMISALRPGDVVSIERISPHEILPGEIVVFAREGRLITHRVVACRGASADLRFITRGDRAHQNDAPVSPTELLGRITIVERGHRSIAPGHWELGRERLLGRILRASDRATTVYLRLCGARQSFAGEEAECPS